MEYSITNLKEVRGLETLRFDAEYFRPRYLAIETAINKKAKSFKNSNKLALKYDASAFYPSLEPFYNKGDLPFIRVSDVNKGINYLESIKIPENILPNFKTLKIGKKGDLVITKGGSIGRVGLIEEESALSRDLIYVNSSALQEFEYQFLFIYFSSPLYNDLLIRSSSMTAQPHLTLTLVKDIPIYDPSTEFKKVIANLYSQSNKFLESSVELYKQAESNILNKINLNNWISREDLTFSVKSSYVQENKRLDAEYYQPQYTEVIDKIRMNKLGFRTLDKAVKIKDKNFLPIDDVEYKYIELSSVSNDGFIKEIFEEKGINLASRARRKVRTGDLMVSSIEGSLSSIALVNKDLDGALASTGFFVLESQGVNIETLFVLLKSKIGQLQLKRGCKGTILTSISKNEFEKIIIPDIDPKTQEETRRLIQEMYRVKAEADHILNIAIKGLEISIKENEKKAEQWINEKT